MRYRFYFSTGITHVFDENVHEAFFEALTLESEWTTTKDLAINIKHVTHVVPEEEVESGVSSTPSPSDILDAKRREEDAIKGDSKAILERAKNKFD